MIVAKFLTQIDEMTQLLRRGFDLGSGASNNPHSSIEEASQRWQQGLAVHCKLVLNAELDCFKNEIEQSDLLYRSILKGRSVDDLAHESRYIERWLPYFESLGSGVNQGDAQEIETLYFDAIKDGELIAEDLWLKVSRLSFYKDDASMRFRFSFGEDFSEDVAADEQRQLYSAKLCDSIFPESLIISQNSDVIERLQTVTGLAEPRFVERIIYYNAPNGGAYLHHDLERGHAGVVYAQLTGETLWLACPRYQLVDEIIGFVEECDQSNQWPETVNAEAQQILLDLISTPETLIDALESFNHDQVIHLINETKEFVQHIISQGHAYVVKAGDLMLLPQKDWHSSCWHSVFCLGETSGQALSFAIR